MRPPAASAWTAHRTWIGIVALPIVFGIVLDASGTVPGMMAPVTRLSHYGLVLLLVPWFAALAVAWRRVRCRLSWREALASARRAELADARLLDFALVVLGMRAMLMTAVAYKVALPRLRPFTYDATLMALDRALHGGRLPHEWLLLGDRSLRLIDVVYGTWYVILGAWVLWMAARGDSPHRRRSLVAMSLLWTVLGCVMAYSVSSAGPCFFGLVNGTVQPDPYAAALSRIRGLQLVAVGIQGQLWLARLHGPTDLIAGIAAFPSLHVAVPALLALSLPRFRWPLVALTGLTLVGSVALLWHYAVDGYAGMLGAMACWWIAGKLTREPGSKAADVSHLPSIFPSREEESACDAPTSPRQSPGPAFPASRRRRGSGSAERSRGTTTGC